MVLVTVVIVVLNVCLGFVLAVYSGHGPPSLGDGWTALTAELGQRRAQPTAAGQATVADVKPMSTEELLEEVTSASIEDLLDDEPDDEMDDVCEVEAYEDDEEDDVSSLLNPDAPETWDLNEKYVETSILKLNIAMIKSGAKATALDTRLRACRGRTDAETIEQCRAELREDCESYLSEQSEAAEKFSERISELGELSELGDNIEVANLEQAAQVETTLSNLTTMDFKSDLEAANRRLLEELDNLRNARHNLRDNQERAFLAVARYQDRLDKVESRLYDDPLTRLSNRIGIEATLWQWWKEGRQKSRQMSAALFDLDDFDVVNESNGALTGDKILHQFATLLKAHTGKADLAGRYAGQQFLLIMLDVGPRAATKNAEMVRQTLERTTFLSGEGEIHVTVCGGLTEVTPEDTEEGLFKRLEEAVAHAQKQGPNTASFHDGKDLEPVESPNLGAEHQQIRI